MDETAISSMRWPNTADPILVPFDIPAAYDVSILSGLPYAEIPYCDISAEPGKELIRAGLVAQIAPHGGTPWIGNFARGGDEGVYLSGVAHTPDPQVALVMASGQGYFVRADDPSSWKTAATSFAFDVILLNKRSWFVFADGIGLSCYTTQGDLRWRGRLVVDDLRVTQVDGDVIRGIGWSGVMDEADCESDIRFEVDVTTGYCTYIGPVPLGTWWDYLPGRNIRD